MKKQIFYPFCFVIAILSLWQCNNPSQAAPSKPTANLEPVATIDSTQNTKIQPIIINIDSLLKQNDTVWVDMEVIAPDMVFDIRYATKNNFVGEVMYDCPKCFLRVASAKALLQVHNELKTKSYRLKMYDCYRPWSVQNKLWKKVPDARYVAPPSKGSMHNKGAAVDLTIVDKNGQELDMGTEFDFFGKEAYPSYTQHNSTINSNRRLLRSTMEKYGFGISTTEWWHFSYRKKSFKVSNFQWECK